MQPTGAVATGATDDPIVLGRNKWQRATARPLPESRTGGRLERSSSSMGPDGPPDKRASGGKKCSSSLCTLAGSGSSSGSASSLATGSSLGSGSNWLVAKLRGSLALGADSNRAGDECAATGPRRSSAKSEGTSGRSPPRCASEINIAHGGAAGCLASVNTNNNNDDDNKCNLGDCRVGLRAADANEPGAEDSGERATDCCNRRRSSDSNQFNTYQRLAPSSRRHKHSLVCAEREITITQSSAAPAAANNTTPARCSQATAAAASSSAPIEHDADSRCLAAANYDTATERLSSQRRDAQHTRARAADDDNNNNDADDDDDDANSSSIAVGPKTESVSAGPGSPTTRRSQAASGQEEQQKQQARGEPDPRRKSPRTNETEEPESERPAEPPRQTLWRLLSSSRAQLTEQPGEESHLRELPEVVVVGRGQRANRQRQQQQQEQTEQRAGRPAQANEVMDILRYSQSSQEDRLAHKTYPNNTLIVDLSKCHTNITRLLPHPSQVSGTRSLKDSIRGCWPPVLRNHSSSRYSPGKHLKKAGRRRGQFNYHMPESLLRTNVTLKAEDYDRALSVLSSDVRFQLHLLLYRRVQTVWILLSTILCILVPILLANLEALVIVCACCLWVGLQILGALVTAQFRRKLDQMLEKSVAQVNSYFMEHNLMLGVINVGGLLSKAKLVIPMLYFDTTQCREQIESIISVDSRNDADGNSAKCILDYTRIDLPLTKPNVMALAQSQLAKKIVLRYSQRWISYFDKRKLMFTDDQIRPRHLSTGKCLCQFIEEHFRNNEHTKQQEKHNQPIKLTNNTKVIPTANSGRPTAGEAHAVGPQVILRKTTQLAPPIPTLSRLVSLKESPDQFKIDLEAGQKTAQQKLVNGLAPNSWYLDMGQEHHQEQPTGKGAPVTSETPVSSPDLSLEMGGDLISRSDELVRKLRLLLELRKNDLQGIDGSLFSSVLYKTPQTFNTLIPCDSRPETSDNNSLSRSEVKVELEETHNNNNKLQTRTTNEGKRHYSQREGLFFLGSSGAKKIQQSTNRNNHVLEIC